MSTSVTSSALRPVFLSVAFAGVLLSLAGCKTSAPSRGGVEYCPECEDDGTGGSGPVEGTGGAAPVENPSSGGAPGAAGVPNGAGGAMGGTPIPGFDVPLTTGTFWDYRWATRTSSYGSTSSTNSGYFRVALGDAKDIGGKIAYAVHVFNRSEFSPRWKYLGYSDGLFFGSEDASTVHNLIDANTGFSVGAGFFADLGDTLWKARQASFSNSLVSGSGVLLERSSSSTDRVCVDGYGCVSGSAPDTNMTQQEFYMPGIGAAGYYFKFSIDGGFSNQQTTTEEVGLAATSLRGDEGLFTTESEPNDSWSGATQPLTVGKTMVGTTSSSDASVSITHTYVNPQGFTIGSASDTVQDCYRVDASQSQSPSFELNWDADACFGCQASLVLFDALEGNPVYSANLNNPHFSEGWLSTYLFDTQIAQYGNSYVACIGIQSSSPIEYTLSYD